MICKVSEKAYAEMLDKDVHNAFVFNIYQGKVTLMADMEMVDMVITSRIETMRFDFPDDWTNERVADAVSEIRGYYAGGIYMEDYANKDDAMLDFMAYYEGLLYRHYSITPETTIGEISRLPDGIAYVYIEEENE